MMRAPKLSSRLFASLLLAAGLCLSGAVSAAPQGAPLEAAAAQRSLYVNVDRSETVEIDEPASTVFIANPEVADVQVVTPNRIMVFGKKPGETTLIISGDGGKLLAQRAVSVKPNLSELQRALLAISPDHPLRAEAVPGGLILSGEATNAAIVEEARRLAARYVPSQDGDIINRIKISANDQIQIRVRFAEVSRDVDKRFGIDWETVGNVGGFAFGLATGADFVTAGATNWTRTAVGSAVNDAAAVSYNNNHYSVNGMIDALAQNGLVTILAEPSLTALSGETASFLAGGEFPVPVPQSADTITINWKQYGVSLAFTPTIIGENRINLHVRPEVSQLSDVGSIKVGEVQVPALTTRRAETTIELNSGQSFAIAGLLNNQQSQSLDKFPFLGDLPVLGPLFRSSRFQNNESELVIIITPYVVKPVSSERLALPTDGFSPPSDTDYFFKMRETNGKETAPPLSGPPRAVRVEEMKIDDAPQPVAAPAPSVDRETPPAPISTPKKPAPAPVKAPEPAKPKPAAVKPPEAPKPAPVKEAPAPAPEPAPAASAPAKEALPAPISTPAPAKKKPVDLPAPSGPGGFIME